MTNHPAPIATVDVVPLTIVGDDLCVVLAERDADPWAGVHTIPGGFVHVDEDDSLDDTAARVLRAKLGPADAYLEQLATFSGRDRDPRGWSLSVAYYALLPDAPNMTPSGGAVETRKLDGTTGLPFDHDDIVAAASRRVRNKATYSSLPAFLLPNKFTMPELQEVYETVTATRLDRAAFRRKVIDQGIVEATGETRRGRAHRPAELYRCNSSGLTELVRPFRVRST